MKKYFFAIVLGFVFSVSAFSQTVIDPVETPEDEEGPINGYVMVAAVAAIAAGFVVTSKKAKLQ